ncbi:Holliday junction branch migration protein RuvA [Chryseomicrobium excrementi]|uniref:Holliday junction branch migration complex subunit RuvA n=1 Tax=Chryseomicrobium excrementi TaxID=2041346 RepID=A0A2M9F213_9BACL|nr:Holliday junction branch migration protein RuvA [Chryseomicrobium excrementi]PJK17492.1 Holliday junction branch migration protein RuvA [Chryseomicrobium excrementi]
MYDYIKGEIARITPEYIVIDRDGLGFQILTPNPFRFQVGQQELVYTYLQVREDLQQLIGFKTLSERELFRKLIQVTGIGPKGALAILASGQPEQVIGAIEREDDAFLVKFPGVGKKTARQIILDLKGKLHDLADVEYTDGLFELEDDAQPAVNQSLDEALQALQALGYSERELKKIASKLEEFENETTDVIMKKALQLLFGS